MKLKTITLRPYTGHSDTRLQSQDLGLQTGLRYDSVSEVKTWAGEMVLGFQMLVMQACRPEFRSPVPIKMLDMVARAWNPRAGEEERGSAEVLAL